LSFRVPAPVGRKKNTEGRVKKTVLKTMSPLGEPDALIKGLQNLITQQEGKSWGKGKLNRLIVSPLEMRKKKEPWAVSR